MPNDLKRIYQVFDPSPLSAEQTDLYVNLDTVRGSSGLVDRLAQNVRLAAAPTCQLLAGHHGSGKSTELRRLQRKLQNDEDKFFAVLCDMKEDMDPNDVDFPDVLVGIIRQTAVQLRERLSIELKPGYFKQRWEEVKSILGREVDLSAIDLDVGLAKFSAVIKDSPDTRVEIRKRLEPHTSNWIEAANDVISKAELQLSKKGYAGLVIIVDGLDRVSPRYHESGRCTLAEYLFANRFAQLTAFKCHVVYTMPISVAYSCRERNIAHLYGYVAPPVIPMVMVCDRNGRMYKDGFDKFKELIEKRCRKANVKTSIFEKAEVEDKVIEYSGGQPREVMTLIRDCLVQAGLPIKAISVEQVARKIRHAYDRQLREEHWEIVKQVQKDHRLKRNEDNDHLYMELLDSRAILQYENGGEWYGVNPLLPSPPGLKKKKDGRTR
jgi:energy-coupling factor transporter ATP-binding protein EcfA2